MLLNVDVHTCLSPSPSPFLSLFHSFNISTDGVLPTAGVLTSEMLYKVLQVQQLHSNNTFYAHSRQCVYLDT